MIARIIICCLLFAANYVFAQNVKPPFYDDIQAFKRQDSISFPAKHAILFVGSSSFTKWTDVQDYFPGYPIVNRGFGGSTLVDVTNYVNDIIIPYEPKQIVIYCGENDIAYADTIAPYLILVRFQALFNIIRKKYPSVPIAFISLKPSPSRQKLWPKMIKANRLIKNYLSKKRKTAFIDVYHNMFQKDGTIMKEIFTADDLHMNEKGYHIWQKIIQPYLVK
ncbi:MAG: GDSL-type esterase/lipase family protein [Ferruginibacter sp.]